MSEKAKLDKPGKARVNRYGFLGLWIGGQVIGWFILNLVFQLGLGQFLASLPVGNNWLLAPIMAIFVGIPTVLIQKLALYLGFGRWFRGWARANLAAWFLGTFLLTGLVEAGLTGNGRFELTIQVLTLMLLPSLVQAWVFSRYIRRVWLWLASTLAASTVFATIAQPFIEGEWGIRLAFGSYAVVTGLTLLWLFGMQAKENEVKNLADTSRLEDGAEANAEPEEQEVIESETEQAQ